MAYYFATVCWNKLKEEGNLHQLTTIIDKWLEDGTYNISHNSVNEIVKLMEDRNKQG